MTSPTTPARPDPDASADPLRWTAHRGPVLGTRGMVASSQPLATAAGLEVLRSGGNAADAAVACAAALCVTEPNCTGLGGDCFALHYEASSGALTALNGSGRAPRGLSLERLARDGFAHAIPPFHAHAVTVPGACAGWCDLLERHGRIGLSRALEPAIALAERGFPVGPVTAHAWSLGVEKQLLQSESGRELLIDGRAPRTGERFRNPGLANVLRAIAGSGRAGFYEGPTAAAIARIVREHGGTLDERDLREHASTWDAPIRARYRGLDVWECPPNSQGLVVLLALQILEGLDLASLDPLGPERVHCIIEALRLAFADARAYVSDPRSCPAPLEALLGPAHGEARRRQIAPDRVAQGVRPGPWHTGGAWRPGSDTVYLCAVDGDGNACSFIQSNYQGFGTGLVPRGCGFSLQNRGLGFDLDPAHPNALEPGKRPYHTIIPGMITRAGEGGLYGPFGVMGAFMQPQGHVQVLVSLLDDGLDPQAALDRPRFLLEDGLPDGRVVLEPEIPAATREGLLARGHRIALATGWNRLVFGKGQVIRRDSDGVLWGGSEPRADGCAMPLG
jgi:gamma-glutamyltranspeptidase/glutathione hydrolase